MGKMTLSQMVAQLAGGMGTSIQIFVVTLVFSLPLGLIVAFGRMTKTVSSEIWLRFTFLL